MHSAVLMSFSSKFVMCVEGCHGDSFGISVDRRQRWALKRIIPYCDALFYQISAHGYIFFQPRGGDCDAVCVLVVCFLQFDIYYPPRNQEKGRRSPAFCYPKVTHTGIVLTAADRISGRDEENVGRQKRKIAMLHIHVSAGRRYRLAVTGQKVDSCCAISSNHLLICCCGESWGCCAVNLPPNTALSGSTPHFINKTIFLGWPVALV